LYKKLARASFLYKKLTKQNGGQKCYADDVKQKWSILEVDD